MSSELQKLMGNISLLFALISFILFVLYLTKVLDPPGHVAAAFMELVIATSFTYMGIDALERSKKN